MLSRELTKGLMCSLYQLIKEVSLYLSSFSYILLLLLAKEYLFTVIPITCRNLKKRLHMERTF